LENKNKKNNKFKSLLF